MHSFFHMKSLKSGVYFTLTRNLTWVAKFPLDFIQFTLKKVDSHIKAVVIVLEGFPMTE